METINFWLCVLLAVVHSSFALPTESAKHSELRQEIEDIKEEIASLFEKVNELAGSDDDAEGKERQESDDVRNPVCLSKECIGISHGLFQRMDLNAKPCDDFNQFACGNYIKEIQIPDDKSRLSAFSPASDKG